MSLILRPLSFLYDCLTQGRNAAYEMGLLSTYHSKLPVISIGNLTVGGTGKTPLASLICRQLKLAGYAPVVLSRGYRGRVRSPHHVTAADSPALVGDEPRMLAQQEGFPVVVSPDRVAGAKFIEQIGLGSVIVLDDGLQHRRLSRAFDILSIDCSSDAAINAFVAGRLLPEGRFRENRERGLGRVQAVVLNARRPKALAPNPAPLERLLPSHLPIFRAFIEVCSVEEFRSGQKLPPGNELLPFCALGNPEGFLATVRSLGHPTLPAMLKPDHVAFTTEEILSYQKAHPGAALICSAKDVIKIPADIKVPIYLLKVSSQVENQAQLMALITALLERQP